MGIFRLRPSAAGEANPLDTAPGRHGVYGDSYTMSVGSGGSWVLADEGSYFAATNPTLATGVAGHAAPVVADTDTKPFLLLYNGGDKVIFPDFAQFEVTVAGTAGTIQYLVCYIDSKGSSAYTSGGSSVTPVSTRTSGGASTGATLYVGAVVAAMSNSKKVGQQIVREVIPVVQDTITVVFGYPGGSVHSALTTAGNLNLSFIRPSQSAAASYQFQLGYFER